jgi:hypothetical protein
MALATFGVQKLRGKSTKRSLRDAMMIGGLGQLGGMAAGPRMQVLHLLDQEQDKFQVWDKLEQCKD